jgi:serine/tyrosine/threonine adenylyltransferase
MKSDPRYLDLGAGFADRVSAARFPAQTCRYKNTRAAERVGFTGDDAAWQRHFALFEPLPGNLQQPLAMRYHGHQFGHYNPRLGDGRGFLFGQVRDLSDGRLLDFGTKGSGQTPWSRDGDGRLTLKGGVREVLATSMLEALGVNTSKTFSLFETGEALFRGDEPSPARSSVLVRLSHSHIRFGTFQRLAHEGDEARARLLVDYCLSNLLPVRDRSKPVTAFFWEVHRRVADLAASWMTAGFVHGVLNTDNMNVTGESFDYGPWRFLPAFDLNFIAAYFDQTGLYAYGRQPETCLWNLHALRDALGIAGLALDEDLVNTRFRELFSRAYGAHFLRRLGLIPRSQAEDSELIERAMELLQSPEVGFARFFFDAYGGIARLSANAGARGASGSGVSEAIKASAAFPGFLKALTAYEPSAPERFKHAYFAAEGPCDMSKDEVEALWDPIANDDDWRPFETKLRAIEHMADALQ